MVRQFLDRLSPAAAGVITLLGLLFAVPLFVAAFLMSVGIMGHAWHWMAIAFQGR